MSTGGAPSGRAGRRRAVHPGDRGGPRVEREGPIWRIRSLEVARQILRARDATTQAGFTAEQIPRGVFRRHPILISDGELHDGQRRELARFFAPAVVSTRYRALMAERADAMVAESLGSGRCRVDEVALHFAVAVTAEVVGLTSSPVPAMSRRLVAFFRQPPFDLTAPRLGRTLRQRASAAFRGLLPVLRFHLADVRPAIRAHRRTPRQDVIGHLLESGSSSADVLVECVTYGTAGMVTTREFITMACWHLLEDQALRSRYLAAGEAERLAILEEVLRLEPVVGDLYRRVQHDLTVREGEEEHHLSPGDLVDIDVRRSNTDPVAVGPHPLDLCPHRDLPRGIADSALAFGDGAHRCPGRPLALLEADALLTRLLAHEPALTTRPRVEWDDLTSGYRVRGLVLDFEHRPAEADGR